MNPTSIVNQYYDAWRHRAGDMTGVPLADDFVFTGPVASFDSADGFRAMAGQAGAAVRSFHVRHQFVDGDLVCSVIDWEMSMVPGTMTAAEVLQVRDGQIVRGELIYDAENLRKALAAAVPDLVALLDRSFAATAEMLDAVDGPAWDAPSPCRGWTVRQVGNHLVGSIALLTRAASDEVIDPDTDAQVLADTDHLGAAPADTFRAAAERAVAAFARPGALDRRFAFPRPDTPGSVLANLCLLESTIHGWDVARGAGVRYRPDPAVVAAVRDFTAAAIGDEQRRLGLFGPALSTPPDADPLTATLGHLGRRAWQAT